MKDHTREVAFARWMMSSILAMYITQDEFRGEVDKAVNDGTEFVINDEPLSDYEQAELKISMAIGQLAAEMTVEYFNAEDEDDEIS